MTEQANELKESLPEQTDDLTAVQDTDTTPQTVPEITVPVKFNKEIKNLTVSEAGNLAQKGMKFDMISSDYERIKVLQRKTALEFLNTLQPLRDSEMMIR